MAKRCGTGVREGGLKASAAASRRSEWLHERRQSGQQRDRESAFLSPHTMSRRQRNSIQIRSGWTASKSKLYGGPDSQQAALTDGSACGDGISISLGWRAFHSVSIYPGNIVVPSRPIWYGVWELSGYHRF